MLYFIFNILFHLIKKKKKIFKKFFLFFIFLNCLYLAGWYNLFIFYFYTPFLIFLTSIFLKLFL